MGGFVNFLSSAATTTDLSSAFGTAIASIKDQALGYIGQALPVGLVIMGTLLAITIGVKAIKRFTH